MSKEDVAEAVGGCLLGLLAMFAAVLIVAAAVGFVTAIYGLGVWLVWNYALVPLVGVEPVSFLISCAIGFGLSIVSNIVFGKLRKRD